MNTVVVNCARLPFARTLGVSHHLIQLCTALADDCELVFAVADFDDFAESPAAAAIENAASEVVSIDEAVSSPGLKTAIELRPHQFQEHCIGKDSILICHDLHVFDIGWKYSDVHQVRDSFRENVHSASAVVAHFPRTYYALERIAQITVMNLFLTESPLLLDTHRAAPPHRSGAVSRILFPAQLQRHKNHEVLIRAAAELRDGGTPIRLAFPGTDFDASHTSHLKELATEFDLKESVEFLGRVTDAELTELYWSSDAAIVPSVAEGGAYVAMEAIAAGLPVAVNEIEAAVLHLGATAAKVHWFDAASTFDTVRVIRALIDADGQAEFDANAIARDRIKQMTWERVAEKWLCLFRWLSGQGPRPLVRVDRTGWDVRFDCR